MRVTLVRRFNVEVGVCSGCGRSVQGRHPLQTSDALHVGTVQIGPEALSLAALWNKEMGLSHERVARSLQLGYGLTVSRERDLPGAGTVGQLAAPTYHQLKASLARSPFNGMDDTGWRVGGRLQNCRVIGNESVTVYLIEPHRGFAEAAAVLGAEYDGFLVHDGAGTWYGFLQAFHQTCLAHLILRCRDLLQLLTGGARQFPQAVLDVLLDSLDLRDRHQQGLVSEHGLAVATGRLKARLDRLLATPQCHAANRRLARHLQHEQPHLFTFLYCPGLSGHQQLHRGSDSADGGGSQNLGREPNLERRPNPTDIDERLAKLLATGQRRFPTAGLIILRGEWCSIPLPASYPP